MDDERIDDATGETSGEEEHARGGRAGRWAATAAVLVALVLMISFTWRVVYFMNGIRDGSLDPSLLAFSSAMSVSRLAASVPSGAAPAERADAPATGPEDAELTIVEFADFDCPYSQEASHAVRAASLRYGDRVRFVFRHYPLDELHPDARRAAEASECAREQGKFWEYHDKLFLNQGGLGEASLTRYADEAGLDAPAFARCLASGRHAASVEADFQAGAAAGVAGTPTFFFNGAAVPGAIPADVLDLLIRQFIGENS